MTLTESALQDNPRKDSAEPYPTNSQARMLHLAAEISRCQVHANLLQLNSDERSQLLAIENTRVFQSIEEEDTLTAKVKQLVPLLDNIFLRTIRAQKYAIDLKGSAAESILEYQQVHAERVAAVDAEKPMLPSREAVDVNEKEVKIARDYWEKDARRARWYGLGLEEKISEY